MSLLDSLIKLVIAALKVLVDYKVAHLPESTKVELSAKERFDNDIQEMQTALFKNNAFTVTELFEQLRSDALAVGASTEPARHCETGGDSACGSGDNPTRQRILQSESDMVNGEIPHGENPAFAPSGVPRRKETNRVTFHHSASDFGDAETIHKWHTERGFACIGYHFVITKDGTIEHGRKLQLVGAHNAGRNADSIGVCVIGHFGKYPMTAPQEEACARLYHDLCRAYGKKLIVECHHEKCPGKFVNRLDFQDVLAKAV